MSNGHGRVLFVFHHLLSGAKKKAIREQASSLSLVGICKVGYPGVLAIYGHTRELKEYIRTVKVTHTYLQSRKIVSADVELPCPAEYAMADLRATLV